jgi:integrase
MQVLDEVWSNFRDSINSDKTLQVYEYCLNQFLLNCDLNLESLLKLQPQQLTNLIIKYISELRLSFQYKNQILCSIKHACEMNDVLLNWVKIKKFNKREKTDNSINGKDRAYTHKEIQQILEYADERAKCAFTLLASTGCRIGALPSIKIGDLEKIDNLYKVTIYAGDKEEHFTFTTPECAKQIDSYLQYREKRGETINKDSYLIVRKFSNLTMQKGKPFKGMSLWQTLEKCIPRERNHNKHKRKEIAIFHGFRKFFTKQLVDSKLNPEIREMLLGHKIGLASAYYKPTEQEMYQEYLKAVNLLTINEESRLKLKLEQKIQIEKSQIEALKADFDAFKKEVLKQRSRS